MSLSRIVKRNAVMAAARGNGSNPLKRILSQYEHPVQVIKRVMRKHGGRLHQEEFDRIFDRPVVKRFGKDVKRVFFPFVPWRAPLGRKGEGEWGVWLDLIKLMKQDGQVRTEGKVPDVYYVLD